MSWDVRNNIFANITGNAFDSSLSSGSPTRFGFQDSNVLYGNGGNFDPYILDESKHNTTTISPFIETDSATRIANGDYRRVAALDGLGYPYEIGDYRAYANVGAMQRLASGAGSAINLGMQT